jgi:hypothetical protein
MHRAPQTFFLIEMLEEERQRVMYLSTMTTKGDNHFSI